ncbi:hypothetical protein AD998_09220 [bacterium 336/3]|nr:hypothetical protein AD998_09220 [bacterium 336/3]
MFFIETVSKTPPNPPQGGNKKKSPERGLRGVSFVDIVFSWKLHQKHLPNPPQGGNKKVFS